jgi:hypothetical protein
VLGEAAFVSNEAEAVSGDVSMCSQCGGVSVFTDQLRMIKIEPAAFREHMKNPNFRASYETAQILCVVMTSRKAQG